MVHQYRRLTLGLLLAVLLLTLLVSSVSAEDPTVTITVSAFVTGYPTGFTITYVSDSQIDATWTNPLGSINTEVRVAYGHVPVDRTDGYQVYLGPEESCSDTSVMLAGPEIPYFAAWTETEEGWGELFAMKEANFMSESFLFIGLIAIAGLLTLFQFRVHFLPLALAAATSWLVLGAWLLTGDVTNLSLETTWAVMLAAVFILMAFVPVLWFIFRMGKQKMTVTGPRGTTEMWAKPGKDTRDRAQKVKDAHRVRLHNAGRRQSKYRY